MNKSTLVKKFVSGAASVALFSISLMPAALALATPAQASTSTLQMTNEVDKSLADRGEILTYTITVKNTNNTSLNNVYLWINKPNLADYVAGSGTYTRTSTGVTRSLPDAWVTDGANFGVVPAGTNVIVKYQTKVAQNANPDDIVWSVAAVKSNEAATIQANSWTRVILKNPALCANKSVSENPARVGDVVTFTIKVCNNGNIVLNDVLIFDRLDSRLTYIPGSTTYTVAGQTIHIDDGWFKLHVNVGNVNPGQEGFLRFKVRVNSRANGSKEIQNVAQVKSNETPNWLQCFVMLKIKSKPKVKVLGKVTKKQELPNTGPGEILALIAAAGPAGLAIGRLRRKI